MVSLLFFVRFFLRGMFCLETLSLDGSSLHQVTEKSAKSPVRICSQPVNIRTSVTKVSMPLCCSKLKGFSLAASKQQVGATTLWVQQGEATDRNPCGWPQAFACRIGVFLLMFSF